MLIAPNTHLTYCTNIHAGEAWADVRRHLETHVLAVRKRVAPGRPLGVGLRLSAAAAAHLAEPGELAWLRAFLAEQGLYVFTLNGFPYGAFHGTRVKEQVYRPDWTQDTRRLYSDELAHILAALLPDNMTGSISTVPGGFRDDLASIEKRAQAAAQMIRHAETLARIHAETGKLIRLALEPEPHCMIETVGEAVAFFRDVLFPGALRNEVAVRRHVGLCLDTCHAAVEFEEPQALLSDLRAAGLTVAKMQLSAGLRLWVATAADLDPLRRFCDDVYLHQVVVRAHHGVRRFLDLPEALAAAPLGEWRVHFHVPLFLERLGRFETTQFFVREMLAAQRRDPIASHLEVETYTWDVLPDSFRGDDVVTAVSRELVWVMDQLA